MAERAKEDERPVALGRRSRLGSLMDHVLDPLFRHAYTLILNTGLTSGVGLLYWIVVGRLFAPEDVGRNAAVISSITFLSGVAQLNLRPVLSRFVPVAGSVRPRLIIVAYSSAAAATVLAAALFLATIDLWAPPGPVQSFRADPMAALLFIGAAVTWTIFALQDGVLIGFRATLSVVVENAAFSIAKLLLVLAFAAMVTRPSYAITASWIIPMLVGIVIVNAVIGLWLVPRNAADSRTGSAPIRLRRIVRFAAGDYVGSLFAMGYATLLPVLVVNQVGEVEAAQFYIPWVIATSLQLLPANMVLSLVVDTATDPVTFARQGHRMLVGMAKVLVPLCLAIALGAPLLLGLFGPSYESGTLLLRLLALAAIPYAINLLFLGRSRVWVNSRRIIVVQAAIAGLVLGLSVVLVPALGIAGVGVAFLGGQAIVATVLLATVLRPLVTLEQS